MKGLIVFLVVSSSLIVPLGTSAAELCASGEKRLREGDACIPAKLFDYLYCLQNSGGGTVEVVRKASNNQENDLQIKLNGKASGVVVKGAANGEISKKDSSNAANELQAKLSPDLAGNCKALADSLREDSGPPSSKRTYRYEFRENGVTYHGAFKNSIPRTWSEYSDKPNTPELQFEEIASDGNWIVLRDGGRNIDVRIPTNGGMSQWQTIGAAGWANLHPVEQVTK